ncbi:MAG: transporter substrate-binding domain-containing protein [Pseudodesulfovibrio sp.]
MRGINSMIENWEGSGVFRRIILCVLLVVGFAVSSAYAADQHEPLTIVTADYPPYEFEKPDGILRGFDVEVAEEAFRRAGITAVVHFYPWKRAYNMVVEGKAAAALSCVPNPTRETDKEIIFSDPISSMTDIYAVRHDYSGPPVQSREDVARNNLAIGTVRGNYISEKWTELGVVHDFSATEELVLRKLFDGRIDVMPATKENFYYRLKKSGQTHLVKSYVMKDAEVTTFHLGMSKKWPKAQSLIGMFNAKLKEMREDGTYDAIHARYK